MEKQNNQNATRKLMKELFVIFVMMFIAQAAGSVFNIKYNLLHISPLLLDAQEIAFQKAIHIFDSVTYPVFTVVWAWLVFRMEYTAIGDAVNTAARIESLTKELGHPVLISEATWESCGEEKPKAQKLAPHPIRGRKEGIVLYAAEI